MEWRTTSTILRDLGADRDEAWRRLVDRFRGPIVGFARRLGHAPADADDLAQETLLQFVEQFRAGRYDRDRGRLGTWLFGIAWHQALRDRRARGRREAAAGPDGEAGAASRRTPRDESEARAIWEREWETALLTACLDRVRREVEPATIEAFEMVVVRDRPAGDAARALGMSVEHVYSAKHRVLTRLRAIREQLERID